MFFAQRDRVYGSALMQIVEHDAFEALTQLDERYVHYEINGAASVSFAYASGEHTWTFELDAERLERLRHDRERFRGEAYLCLICGRDGVCLLEASEWSELLEAEGEEEDARSITVKRPFRHQMEVIGPNGALDHKIPRKRFPEAIFESLEAEHEDGRGSLVAGSIRPPRPARLQHEG